MTTQKPGHICFSITVSMLGIFNILLNNVQGTNSFDSWIKVLYAMIEFLFWAGVTVFGSAILFSSRPRLSAVLMAWMIAVWILMRHVPFVISNHTDPVQWNFACMALAICGGAFVVAGSFKHSSFNDEKIVALFCNYTGVGKILWGISLFILGLQHVLYAEFISSMIPLWIPLRVACAWITGIALMATGVSFLANIKIARSSLAVAWMTLSWLPLVHIPRIIAQPMDLYEWIYAFQALTIGTSSWVLYGLQSNVATSTESKKIVPLHAEMPVVDVKRNAPEINIASLTEDFEKYPASRGIKSNALRKTSFKH